MQKLKLGANHYSANLVDFIVDELGVLQYYRHQNAFTGMVTCKLIQLDFLGGISCDDRLPQPFGVPNPFCSNCKINALDLKRCGRCRRVNYCCAECQRADWLQHKASCFP